MATATASAPTNGQVEDAKPSVSYALKRLKVNTFLVEVEGISPLIVNRWSEKAKRMMLEAQQTKARAKKDARDPEADYQASRYRYDDKRDGFPATAFKAAIVHAARLFDKSLTQVMMKQSVFVAGEGSDQVVPLVGEPRMREDTPRNANGVADLRYRAEYWPWSAILPVSCIDGQFDAESIIALVDAAGVGGVGEWRPTSPKSATGTFGRFRVINEDMLMIQGENQ